ncbi:MAG: MarR family transcriptional regulator [Candidatus Hydrogenedentes bacterium]|nr:MarR family transcriptional regulator [Candidatus Hydrogenedentota bacterium]
MKRLSIDDELHLDRPMDDLHHAAVINVLRTANLFSAVGATFLRQYDLTEAQFNVLLSLKYKERNVTQSDLGERLVVTRASITSVLDKLEGKGLVRRDTVEGNRRIYHVSLTPAGLALINKVEPSYRERVHRVMGGLAESEMRTLIDYLERVRAELHDEASHS